MPNALEAIGRTNTLRAVTQDITGLAQNLRQQALQEKQFDLNSQVTQSQLADDAVKRQASIDAAKAKNRVVPLDVIKKAFPVPTTADYAERMATAMGMVEDIAGVPSIRAGNAGQIYDILQGKDHQEAMNGLAVNYFRDQAGKIRQQLTELQQSGKDLSKDKNAIALSQQLKQVQQGLMSSLQYADQLNTYTDLIGKGFDPIKVQQAMESGDMSLLGSPQEKPTGDVGQLSQVLGRKPTLPELQEYRKSGASQTNIGPLTPGQKKVDEKFSGEYVDWKASGGYADIEKNVGQLNEVLTELESGKDLTGAIIGSIPDSVQKFINPEAISVRNAVEEVVQRNLRLILGAQFTEKEGERLIARAYNQNLSEQENAKRVKRLITQISAAAKAKEDASKYYEENGTLKGWQGKQYNVSDFYSAIDNKEEGPPVKGAKKAPDGNWYVQQNGKFFRVE